MVLELGCSFHDSFFGSLLSLGFPSNLIFEFEPPTSLNGLIFLVRSTMRRDILQYILVDFSSILTNLSSARSQGMLWTDSSIMSRVMQISSSLDSSILATFHKYLRQMWFDTNMIRKLPWLLHWTVRHNKSNKIPKSLMWRLISFRS